MRYATLADVEAGFRTLEEDEQRRCLALLEEAATIIDTCSENAAPDRKQLVSCRMVRRVLGDGAAAQLYPMGATQGSASAMGYTQSWTMSGGSSGVKAGEAAAGSGQPRGGTQPAGGPDMIRGADVLLYVRTKDGEDEFHAPVWRETPVMVHNVLIGEPDAEAVVSDLQLCGRRLAYVLAIPKGDTHDWDGVTVEFFGRKWRTYGGVTEGIEELLPLAWNKKVKVERYE
jgi:hypothetical protein